MKQFRTESKRILDLMINSIYTHKEIFLRELISNSSDAIDKMYYQARTENLSGISRSDFYIRVDYDKDARTISISDNGIGMSEDDLDNNLGTIAHSGTLEFKQNTTDTETNPIGQFGVGFYSAFMVADKVEVTSLKYGESVAHTWSSDGESGYTITEAERSERGSTIVLYLKASTEDENYDEYLDEWRLRSLIKQYSDYVRYPITMNCKKSRNVAGEGEEAKYEDYYEVETINSMVPIWKKPKDTLKDEDYNEYYKANFHDYEAPLTHISYSVEGAVNFTALVYIPARAPFDYYSKDYKKGLSLYSAGVNITEKCEELVPDYFSFLRGIVDSEDLSLNISRETLQHDRQLRAIRQNVEKKVKAELIKLQKDNRDTYKKFFEAFGTQIKWGTYSDFGTNADTLKDLLMFYSVEKNDYVTLKEYVDTMKEGQSAIYYACGMTIEAIKSAPQLEAVRAKGYDVLCLTENIDEFSLKALREYESKQFKNVSAGDLDLNDSKVETTDDDKAILDKMKSVLGDKVADVTLSQRLVSQAVCLTAKGELSIEMEKVLSQMPNSRDVKAEKVLEINKNHPVFGKLKDAMSDDERFGDMADVLYEQARLIEGLPLLSPTEYTEKLLKLL